MTEGPYVPAPTPRSPPGPATSAPRGSSTSTSPAGPDRHPSRHPRRRGARWLWRGGLVRDGAGAPAAAALAGPGVGAGAHGRAGLQRRRPARARLPPAAHGYRHGARGPRPLRAPARASRLARHFTRAGALRSDFPAFPTTSRPPCGASWPAVLATNGSARCSGATRPGCSRPPLGRAPRPVSGVESPGPCGA